MTEKWSTKDFRRLEDTKHMGVEPRSRAVRGHTAERTASRAARRHFEWTANSCLVQGSTMKWVAGGSKTQPLQMGNSVLERSEDGEVKIRRMQRLEDIFKFSG